MANKRIVRPTTSQREGLRNNPQKPRQTTPEVADALRRFANGPERARVIVRPRDPIELDNIHPHETVTSVPPMVNKEVSKSSRK